MRISDVWAGEMIPDRDAQRVNRIKNVATPIL
jgi:hypothetical protein